MTNQTSTRPVEIESFQDTCPVHGGEIKAEYNYGKNDATVITFTECKCCATFTGWPNKAQLFNSWAEASGKAVMVKQINSARW